MGYTIKISSSRYDAEGLSSFFKEAPPAGGQGGSFLKKSTCQIVREAQLKRHCFFSLKHFPRLAKHC